MPNTAAQLVVDPLFRRDVLFFSKGIGEDVLGNLFSSKDLFREQVKTEKAERGKP
jgi:stalled ribosome alternative rescue factor ArfA